jgi:hypothetical protein
MHQIKYRGTIDYLDYDNTRYQQTYQIYASNEDDAKNISKELFYMSTGILENMYIEVEPILPTENEQREVNRKFFEVFGVLKETFAKMNYKQFIEAYENFEGKYFSMRNNDVSYVITFRGVTCRIVYNNKLNSIEIDESEVVFHTTGRDYIIRDNLCNMYIGG